MKHIFFAVVVTLFTFGVNASITNRLPAGQEDESVPSKLRMISASTERIEAEYYTPNGGIHILSEVRRSGEAVRVVITTTSGETIFAVDRPLYSSGLVSIVGKEFLFVNETLDNGDRKLTEYVVPTGYLRRVMNAIKHHQVPKVLRHLDSETVNTTVTTAVDELLARPEVLLIKDAAFAIGNTGLRGVDNPAAMAFYATALRFAKSAVVEDEEVASGEGEHDGEARGLLSKKRGRRGSWWSGPGWCSNSRYYCYNCPDGRYCRGLCGPGCTCWEWVCGDCCWNWGCNWHDRHGCGSGGTSSLQCWLTAPSALLCTPGL